MRHNLLSVFKKKIMLYYVSREYFAHINFKMYLFRMATSIKYLRSQISSRSQFFFNMIFYWQFTSCSFVLYMVPFHFYFPIFFLNALRTNQSNANGRKYEAKNNTDVQRKIGDILNKTTSEIKFVINFPRLLQSYLSHCQTERRLCKHIN